MSHESRQRQIERAQQRGDFGVGFLKAGDVMQTIGALIMCLVVLAFLIGLFWAFVIH